MCVCIFGKKKIMFQFFVIFKKSIPFSFNVFCYVCCSYIIHFWVRHSAKLVSIWFFNFFLYFKKQLWICMKLVRYLSSLSSESFELKKNATSFCSKLDIFMLWFDPYGHCYLAKLSNTISTLPTQQILYLSLWYGVLNYMFLNF